jgi:stage II sporulation protein D
MRRSVLSLITAVLALAGSGPARTAPAPTEAPSTISATTFFVSGRGWGHGVGMSQYGALGFANEGRGYAEILGHFYPGTTLGPAPVARVRVLLQEQRPGVTLSSPVPFRVRDVFGKAYPLAAGEVKLGPTLEVLVNGAPTTLVGPIVFLPGSRPLQVGPLAYRGHLVVSVTGRRLSVVNDVGLEQYLAGVVPKEMPAAWHPEALQAQAVAARSYALAHRLTGKGYDLYADVRSQVYGGVSAEDARATAAIEATGGQVVLYDGKIADTLFHSTSGGRTIAAAEVFGKEVPYLVSVDDPHSALSPVHRWGPVAVTDAVARKGLELRGSITGLRLSKAPSGRIRNATVATAAGDVVVSGADLRRALGLRSTWVTSLGSLTLTRPGTPAVYGRSVTLSGYVKGAKGIVLSQRIDGVWQQVLARPAGGAFTFKTKLQAPAVFRLAAGKLTGPAVKVPVAPRVRVTREAAALAGSVVPPTPGAAVEVQRLEGEAWAAAGRTVVDEAGAFRAELELPPGAYRARVAPAAGYAAGVSATLRIAG